MTTTSCAKPVPTALIAEDEPLLAQALHAELARAWPELQVLATVGDGASAVAQALALQPAVLLLDIRMPGLSGLEAAARLADEWPDTHPDQPFPLLVFVTAYDQYALAAFEQAAVDYLLKPVRPERLAATCSRLRSAWQQRLAAPGPASAPSTAVDALENALHQLRQLVGGQARAPMPGTLASEAPLTVIQAGVGSSIHLVPIDEVVYFEAADKYVQVFTAQQELLIRTPLRELLPRLDAARFWQVHRGTVVRCDAIDKVLRDDSGKLSLLLRGRPDKLVVSRLYAPRFKAM